MFCRNFEDFMCSNYDSFSMPSKMQSSQIIQACFETHNAHKLSMLSSCTKKIPCLQHAELKFSRFTVLD
jgi:hypothetical protein